ncbi:hypothetical protein XENOCAPTIV_004791 [Xenoophorus captivus]|uniref:Uncharacterized protein n=1 Tax=Xenoophorus captivus TaxID=1517983 RepID=A0ABV0QL76_9TELE
MSTWPTLHKLFLTLLALPSSLHRTQVFAKAYRNIKIPPNREKTPKASPQVEKWRQRSPIGRRKLPSLEGLREVRDDGSSSEDDKSPAGKPLTYNKVKLYGSVEETDYTDNSSGQGQLPQKRMVEWYGQRMCSQASVASLKPFAAFSQYFCANSFATLVTYRDAILSSLQEAALRCEKQFSPLLPDGEELLKQMLDWAFGGFQPSGPDGLKPKKGVKMLFLPSWRRHQSLRRAVGSMWSSCQS